MKKDFKLGYSTIPNKVKYDSSIKFLSRMILGDIISYTKNGICFASNKYFADLYNVSIRSIENSLKELRDSGYIQSDYRPAINKRVMIPNSELMDDYSDLLKATDKELVDFVKNETDKYENGIVKDLKKLWED